MSQIESRGLVDRFTTQNSQSKRERRGSRQVRAAQEKKFRRKRVRKRKQRMWKSEESLIDSSLEMRGWRKASVKVVIRNHKRIKKGLRKQGVCFVHSPWIIWVFQRIWNCHKKVSIRGRRFGREFMILGGRSSFLVEWWSVDWQLFASEIKISVRQGKNRKIGADCSLIWSRCSSWSLRSWRYRGREWRRSDGRWEVGEVVGSGVSGRRRWAGGHFSVTKFSRGKVGA